MVAGIIFNLLAYAVASYTYRVLLGHSGGTLQVPMFEPVHLPRLSSLADALHLSLQLFHAGIPAELFIALPYLMTLLAISGIFGKARQPAALLTPYVRD